MLPPDYFDYAADDLLELYSKLDETITRDIVRRLVKTGGVSATADWQIQRLQESGLLLDDIIRAVSQMTDASDQQVRVLFEDAGIQALEIDRGIYQAAGLSPPPLRQSLGAMQVLQAGIQKTAGHLKNLSMTTAVATQQSYINAVTLAEMQVESGAFDYVTAIRNAVRSAAESGAEVLYPTGHRDKLDVAIRRATLTGVTQTAAQISERYADDMGCDLVETTAHPGARPEHQAWQGQVFSRSGKNKDYPDFVESTGYGSGEGLCGWNCRHSFFPFFEGISSSAYPRKTLQEYESQSVQYNGETIKYYDATQMQRAMERQIRATKRELAGYDAGIKSSDSEELKNALTERFQATSVKLSQHKSQMEDFLDQTGMLRQGEREQVLGFSRSQAQKAVWANKRIESLSLSLSCIKTSTGVSVGTVSPHLSARMISRGVVEKDVSDALISPLKTGKIRADKSQQFKGERATVVINTETGKLITVWPTGTKTAKKLKEGGTS
ncbi:MAG: phage minor capsid protein [Clostridium sp.]|uniref:phage minor capsid protein n=1 Tax=Clostridium sp. TaxID=1506 RepID=UPI00290D9BF2|nr:phage minor capsid protein [Clostridium sp.]MDU7338601.1 phage minor capsid protein [Clostridium sp.]